MNIDNLKTYLVGGAVRDELLNLPVKERDWVVVGATAETMLSLGFIPVGKDFPVFLHPHTKEEYALARIERKTAKGYHGFQFDTSVQVTLEEDLLRRDLTINAIAKDKSGKIIDPFNGVADLKLKILRHVSAAFTEDPVRILRIARFAARFAHLGFTVAPETISLMHIMVDNGEVDALQPERVWKEMERALGEKTPVKFIEILREVGALRAIFPDLDKLWGVPQTAKWHPEIDTGVHVLLTLTAAANLSSDPKVRFAALCHDLGKGETPQANWPRHHGHEEAGVELITAWCKAYRVPKEYAELAKITARYHLMCHKILELKPGTILKLLENIDAFRRPIRLELFLLAVTADAKGRLGKSEDAYPQAEILKAAFKAALAVNASAFADSNITGVALGAMIRQARIKAIKKIIALFNK